VRQTREFGKCACHGRFSSLCHESLPCLCSSWIPHLVSPGGICQMGPGWRWQPAIKGIKFNSVLLLNMPKCFGTNVFISLYNRVHLGSVWSIAYLSDRIFTQTMRPVSKSYQISKPVWNCVKIKIHIFPQNIFCITTLAIPAVYATFTQRKYVTWNVFFSLWL